MSTACSTCRFFEVEGEINLAVGGLCRRYPPVTQMVVDRNSGRPAWENAHPWMGVGDWCGEWAKV